MKNDKKYLDKDGLPTRQGVYLARGVLGSNEPQEIDVYRFPKKELCCFTGDYGGEGAGVKDETDCHVSVQFTGLEFISWVGNIKN